MANPRRRLRELLAADGVIRSLGAHDVLTARLVERAGLETVFIGGFGISASLLGLPDQGFLTQTEMADAARRTAAAVRIPVIVDGDTGHGDLPQVRRTIALFEQAGAAGTLIEDQVSPKRCGHFAGKQVVSVEEMEDRLAAALEARADPDFVIIARTDARAPEGLAAAIERANRYGERGADVVFVEAPESLAELGTIAREVAFPQLVNMLVGGRTPIRSVDELAAMGFKIVVSPIETLLAAARAAERVITAWVRDGRVDGLAGETMMTFAEVKALLGADERPTARPGG